MRNIVGGAKTQPLATRRAQSYNTGTDYIDSELGGYGLYYRSVMISLGLIYPGGPGFPYPVDLPTEKGRAVAESFRRAVKDTEYYQRYFDEDLADIPIGVVESYIRRACLCQLQRSDVPDRALVLDAFLHGGEGESPAARRKTLRLLLDIVDQTDGFVLDQDAFRQLLYFGTCHSGAAYAPRDDLTDIYRRWRLYQAREYYGFALNALWYYLCDWGISQHGEVRPVELDQLWSHLDGALDFGTLAARLSLPPPNLRAVSDVQAQFDWLTRVNRASEETFDTDCGLDRPLSEQSLYALAQANRGEPDVMVAGMVALLGLVYLRFGHRNLWMRPDWDISRMGADGRLSLDGFVKAVQRRMRLGSFTMGAFARWLVDDYVILQHQLVAAGKLPDNTYRFQREGSRLRFYRRENALAFMDSRYSALSTTVYELGLCGSPVTSTHPLTPDGRLLLQEGDLR
ncbi:MAG: hypothetical protein GX616_24705 [Planctomycetes bacterium]|nr:hypothetical protein [Planctomycetota bacterium]